MVRFIAGLSFAHSLHIRNPAFQNDTVYLCGQVETIRKTLCVDATFFLRRFNMLYILKNI